MLPVIRLPTLLAAVYRPATDREICSWSFGAVKAPRDPVAVSWQAQRGTLNDQAIFGPLRDFHCACGKYEGQRHQGMICDWCGVKVTTRAVRRLRFGHIKLPVAVPHPLGEAGELLSAVPVLPAAFWQAPSGSRLAQVYDEFATMLSSGICKAIAGEHARLPEGTAGGTAELLAVEMTRLIEVLLPVTIFAHEWDLAECEALARGLALEHRNRFGS